MRMSFSGTSLTSVGATYRSPISINGNLCWRASSFSSRRSGNILRATRAFPSFPPHVCWYASALASCEESMCPAFKRSCPIERLTLTAHLQTPQAGPYALRPRDAIPRPRYPLGLRAGIRGQFSHMSIVAGAASSQRSCARVLSAQRALEPDRLAYRVAFEEPFSEASTVSYSE